MLTQNNTRRRRLIVIVGPTASGKSSLSLAVANHYSAPIISTDSRQLYRGIPIGTAQPTAAELAQVEHHFIACRELAEDYNAGQYELDAIKLLDELFEQHETVVAVGGSGLYIKALCEGLDELPSVDPQLRAQVRDEYAQHGLEPLLEELRRCDPAHYERIDRCNPSRVMRAIELCRTSPDGGCTALRTAPRKSRNFEIVKIGLDLPRATLYERIDGRVDVMLAEGLEAEVRGVYAQRDLNSLQSVGYREFFDYFSGLCDYDRAVELIKRNSRRYAKRQMTWFRADADIEWFAASALAPIVEYIDSRAAE